MKLVDVLTRLKGIGEPVLRTADVMACLNVDKAHASKLLARLENSGHLVHAKRGLWVFPGAIEAMAISEHLTAPFPCYVSLQSALYFHGMISQIPDLVYVVSVARTRVYRISLGTYSIHHVHPSFFFGFDNAAGFSMASPEKAIIDVLYLGPAKSRLFSSIPELEFPDNFDFTRATQIVDRIASPGRRTLVEKRFMQLVDLYRKD
jgi:predicted transcriptional regulator of viral defense system